MSDPSDEACAMSSAALSAVMSGDEAAARIYFDALTTLGPAAIVASTLAWLHVITNTIPDDALCIPVFCAEHTPPDLRVFAQTAACVGNGDTDTAICLLNATDPDTMLGTARIALHLAAATPLTFNPGHN